MLHALCPIPNAWRFVPWTLSLEPSFWARQKAELLHEAAYEVVTVDTSEKRNRGKQARSLLASGGDWEHLVSKAVSYFHTENWGTSYEVEDQTFRSVCATVYQDLPGCSSLS